MSEAQNTSTKRPRRSRRRDFGSIVSLGTPSEPRFLIRWQEGPRRRQESGFLTRKAAQERLAAIRTELAAGGTTRARVDMTFEEVAGKFLELHSSRLRSHKTNCERYALHVRPRLGHVPIAAVSAERLLQFRNELTQKNGVNRSDRLSVGTVNRVLALVRSILRFGVVHQYLPASPTDRMPRGGYLMPVERRHREPPIPDARDVGRLLEHLRTAQRHYFALFATALLAGLRKGELAGLTWADVTLETGFLTVKRSYSSPTKSAKWRIVPLPDQLRGILAEHRLRYGTGGTLVFPTPSGEMVNVDVRLHKMLGDACQAIGLKRIRLHDCRHQYASSYLAAGGNVSDLKENLGHSSLAVTELYSHVADAHRLQEAQRLRFDAPKPGLAVVGEGQE